MSKALSVYVPACCLLFVLLLSACRSSAAGVLDGDIATALAHNDVVYLSPAHEGWEGLPLGNGTLGAQIWQPDGLTFQLNTPLSGCMAGLSPGCTFVPRPPGFPLHFTGNDYRWPAPRWIPASTTHKVRWKPKPSFLPRPTRC